jgi:hypothetical protein
MYIYNVYSYINDDFMMLIGGVSVSYALFINFGCLVGGGSGDLYQWKTNSRLFLDANCGLCLLLRDSCEVEDV